MSVENEVEFIQAQAYRSRLLGTIDFAQSRLSETELHAFKAGVEHQISAVEEEIRAYERRLLRSTQDFAWNMLGIKVGKLEVSSQSVQESKPSVRFSHLSYALVE